MVCVDFGQKNRVLTEETSFGRFWPEKVVLVDFHWKTGFDRNNWLWLILAEKVVLVDFDRKYWFRPILTKKLVLVDFCRK